MVALPLVGRSATLELLERRVAAGAGVVLAGAAGVGKSRLLDALLDRCGPEHHVERFTGTPAAQSIRFGALMTVVAENPASDGASQLAAIRSTLLARASERVLVLAVDDLHLLDTASLACVADLATRGDALLLATIRLGEETPETVTALWAGDHVDRVDVGPLDDDATAALIDAVLGGPADTDLSRQVAERAGNNPLFVRELLLDALASSAVVAVDGRWRLVSPLRPGARLADVIRARTGRLAPGELDVLDLIAVGQPLAMAAFAGAECDAVDRLEAHALARTELRDGRVLVSCNQSLVGQTIVEDMAVRRRVDVLDRLIDRHDAIEPAVLRNALQVAGWCAEVGRPMSPDIADLAAREAMASLDLELAASLAEETAARTGHCRHLVTLGDVHRLSADPAEADACFRRAHHAAESEADRVLATKRRALLHAHQLGRPDIAVRLAATEAEALTDPVLIVDLERFATEHSSMIGRYDEAFRASTRLLEHDDGRDQGTRRAALNSLVYAQVMLGRLEGVDGRIDECLADADAADWTEVLWALRTGVFIQRGELIRGERALRSRLEHTSDQSVGLGATMQLQLLLYRAAPSIFDLIGITRDELARADPFGAMPIASGLSACALAQAGDLDAARRALRSVPDAPADARAQPFVARGRAAILAMTGEPERAAAAVVDAGRAAVASTHVVFGITTLHDAVRFGHAADVADEMVAAARLSTGRFTRALVEDAVATRDGDGRSLARLATRFHQFGAPVMAAESMARATHALEGDSTDARLADTRLALLTRAVGPFLTPPGAPVTDALTERELDVAAAASGVRPSREVADELFISVRTVDNHLRQVYRKLGLAGRSELATALGPFVAPPEAPVSRS
ncbi:MAG: LuxR family transcriptional regulator [Acidimicrobiales bacterium]|nr:MAG: LuxR family transcriptional regulator [Acidimicrobiales bacterium]